MVCAGRLCRRCIDSGRYCRSPPLRIGGTVPAEMHITAVCISPKRGFVMKRRSFVAGGSVLAAISLLVMPIASLPASAAPQQSEHSFVQNGFTATWADTENFSDIEVTRTPGVKDSLESSPDAEIGTEVISAWQYASDRLEGDPTISPREPNGCSFSPDKWGKANFKPTCDKHDVCYSKGSKTDRKRCDDKFMVGLVSVCKSTYGIKSPKFATCSAIAGTYYQAVRKVGKSFYKGSGNPA